MLMPRILKEVQELQGFRLKFGIMFFWALALKGNVAKQLYHAAAKFFDSILVIHIGTGKVEVHDNNVAHSRTAQKKGGKAAIGDFSCTARISIFPGIELGPGSRA
jgi:hypothetical protein